MTFPSDLQPMPVGHASADEVNRWADLVRRHHPDADECGIGRGCPDYAYALTQLGTHNQLHLIGRKPMRGTQEAQLGGKTYALDIDNWRKSTFSDNSGGNCVEVQPFAAGVALRDSKHPDGPVLAFTRDEWTAFRDGVTGGEFADI